MVARGAVYMKESWDMSVFLLCHVLPYRSVQVIQKELCFQNNSNFFCIKLKECLRSLQTAFKWYGSYPYFDITLYIF